MITNDERRRIAAKLRACAGTEYIEVEELCEVIECTDGFRGTDGEPAIWNRLADLIDPETKMAQDSPRRLEEVKASDGSISQINRETLQVTYSRSTGGPDGKAYMVKVRHRDKGWERDFYAVDCEALLALANEMDHLIIYRDEMFRGNDVVEAFYDYADRIREACGEVRP